MYEMLFKCPWDLLWTPKNKNSDLSVMKTNMIYPEDKAAIKGAKHWVLISPHCVIFFLFNIILCP